MGSITLTCPECHEPAGMSLSLADGSFTCHECEAEMAQEDIVAALEAQEAEIAKWRKVLAWTAKMPVDAE